MLQIVFICFICLIEMEGYILGAYVAALVQLQRERYERLWHRGGGATELGYMAGVNTHHTHYKVFNKI